MFFFLVYIDNQVNLEFSTLNCAIPRTILNSEPKRATNCQTDCLVRKKFLHTSVNSTTSNEFYLSKTLSSTNLNQGAQLTIADKIRVIVANISSNSSISSKASPQFSHSSQSLALNDKNQEKPSRQRFLEMIINNNNGSRLRSGDKSTSKASQSAIIASNMSINSSSFIDSESRSNLGGFKRLEIMKSQQELIEECKNSLNELIKASKWSSGVNGAANNCDYIENRRKSESNRSLANFYSNSAIMINSNQIGDQDNQYSGQRNTMKKSATLINQTFSSIQKNPGLSTSASTTTLARENEFSSCLNFFEKIKPEIDKISSNLNNYLPFSSLNKNYGIVAEF